MRVVAIIQARMGSSRLPGKVMADIASRPMLWQVFDRVRQARKVQQAVVATTLTPQDDELTQFCVEHSIECVRGSENDVLDRYFQAAKKYQADTVVRVTADC